MQNWESEYTGIAVGKVASRDKQPPVLYGIRTWGDRLIVTMD